MSEVNSETKLKITYSGGLLIKLHLSIKVLTCLLVDSSLVIFIAKQDFKRQTLSFFGIWQIILVKLLQYSIFATTIIQDLPKDRNVNISTSNVDIFWHWSILPLTATA